MKIFQQLESCQKLLNSEIIEKATKEKQRPVKKWFQIITNNEGIGIFLFLVYNEL